MCLKGDPKCFQNFFLKDFTPQKSNMEPENDGCQKESPFPGISEFFSGSMLNFWGVVLFISNNSLIGSV